MPDSLTSEPKIACDLYSAWNPSCAGEAVYQNDGKNYCVLHFPSKEKSAEFEVALRYKLEKGDFNFEDVWFPYEVSFVGMDFTNYTRFMGANFQAKADFQYATFSNSVYFSSANFVADANFSSATFSSGSEARFEGATFSGEADFSSVKFKAEAYFQDATFSLGGQFSGAEFNARADFTKVNFGTEEAKAEASFFSCTFASEADFNSACFNGVATFTEATFGAETNFDDATFGSDASFVKATLAGDTSFAHSAFRAAAYFGAANVHERLSFTGTQDYDEVFTRTSSLDLQRAKIENFDHISFDTVRLCPRWFVNVDATGFVFVNVDWDWRKTSEELALVLISDGSSRHRILSIACQRLATNTEEKNQYEDASRFRYLAMDARRLEKSFGFAVWKLSWWYWLTSGYGEKMLRAFFVLLGILILFAVLYHYVGFVRWEPKLASEADAASARGDDHGMPLEFRRALAYSAGVMTLQRPEPKPATRIAQAAVLLETVLGPVQAALLALAIRRRFLRL